MEAFAPGFGYVGEPGEWYVQERDDLDDDDPFWLLAILEGTVSATPSGDQTVLGERRRLFTGTADFELAAGRTTRRLSQPVAGSAEVADAATTTGDLVNPVGADDVDALSFSIEVWLDEAGRICRAILHGPGKSVTQMELSTFAEPAPIALPASDEIVHE